MSVIYPPNEIFESTPNYENSVDVDVKTIGGHEGTGWVESVYQPNGGSYKNYFPVRSGYHSYYESHPYPRKGHVYPEAVKANNQVKREILSLVLPFTIQTIPSLFFFLLVNKKKFSENLIINFIRKAVSIYMAVGDKKTPIPYLRKEFYKNPGKEVWDFTTYFLEAFGFEGDCLDLGKQLATIIEYDDAYQYRLQDLCTETSKEALLENPRKELEKVLKIYSKREGNDTHRILLIGRLLIYLFWFPKFKKAFRFALEQIDFRNLQLDDADRYWCFMRPDYNFFGASLDSRQKQLRYLRTRFLIINNN